MVPSNPEWLFVANKGVTSFLYSCRSKIYQAIARNSIGYSFFKYISRRYIYEFLPLVVKNGRIAAMTIKKYKLWFSMLYSASQSFFRNFIAFNFCNFESFFFSFPNEFFTKSEKVRG